MKRFDLKSILIGTIIGAVGLTTAFAAGGIKSATYSKSKVFFYGQEVPLQTSLVSIIEEGSNEAKLYMPVRELLEYMNFIVDWNAKDSSVHLSMKGQDNNYSQSDSFTTALEIMMKTGNWTYIENYLPNMSNEGIDLIVNLYNSKHPDPAEHKKASDYYNAGNDENYTSNWILQTVDRNATPEQLNNMKITKQTNGTVSITSGDRLAVKDVTTDEVWSKMNMQIFYIYGGTVEEYVIYKNDKFEHLPGPYAFDGGNAQFCVSDLDKNNEYELLSIFHAGSGMDYQFLTCYIPQQEISSNFGTANNRYTFSKTDDQNVFVEFSTGEKARVTLTQIGNKSAIIVVFPSGLSKEMSDTVLSK